MFPQCNHLNEVYADTLNTPFANQADPTAVAIGQASFP